MAVGQIFTLCVVRDVIVRRIDPSPVCVTIDMIKPPVGAGGYSFVDA